MTKVSVQLACTVALFAFSVLVTHVRAEQDRTFKDWRYDRILSSIAKGGSFYDVLARVFNLEDTFTFEQRMTNVTSTPRSTTRSTPSTRLTTTTTTEVAQDPDVFRDIFQRANSLEGLFDSEGGVFGHHGITLSPEALRWAFQNFTSSVSSTGMTVPKMTTTQRVPLKHISIKMRTKRRTTRRRLRSTKSTRRTSSPTIPSTSKSKTTFTVRSSRETTVKATEFKTIRRQRFKAPKSIRPTLHFVVTKRALRKAFTRPKPTTTAIVNKYNARTISRVAKSKLNRTKHSHLRLPRKFLTRRFGNISDVQVQEMNGDSPTKFTVPEADAYYKKAAIYRTQFMNTSVELFCIVAFGKAASILWRIGGQIPEEVINTGVAYTVRDGYKVIISRLWLPRLEILPSTNGIYTFQCLAKADDADAKSEVDVTGYFNDSCIDNSDCEFKHAICVFGKCECKDFMPVSLRSKHTTCRAVGYIGWPCHYNEQCSYAVSESACRAQKCDCKPDYVRGPQNASCVLKSVPGRSCNTSSDCRQSKALCRNGSCECPEGTKRKDGICTGPTPLPLLEMVKKKIVVTSDNDTVAPGAKTEVKNVAPQKGEASRLRSRLFLLLSVLYFALW